MAACPGFALTALVGNTVLSKPGSAGSSGCSSSGWATPPATKEVYQSLSLASPAAHATQGAGCVESMQTARAARLASAAIHVPEQKPSAGSLNEPQVRVPNLV